MKVKSVIVLGSGCSSCEKLNENTKKAVSKLGLNVSVQYVTDLQKIMEFDVMQMPALVINDKVVSQGKVLNENEVLEILQK